MTGRRTPPMFAPVPASVAADVDAQAAHRQTVLQMAQAGRGSDVLRMAALCIRRASEGDDGDWRLARVELGLMRVAGEVDAHTFARVDAELAACGVPLALQVDVEAGVVEVAPDAAQARRPARDDVRPPPPAYRCPETLALPLDGAPSDTGGAA